MSTQVVRYLAQRRGTLFNATVDEWTNRAGNLNYLRLLCDQGNDLTRHLAGNLKSLANVVR